MDVDELDRWLDADDGDGDGPDGRPAGDRPGGDRVWPDVAASATAGGGRRRPRWLVPLVVAGGVWLAVAALLLLGGGDGQPQGGSATPAPSPAAVVDPDLATGPMAGPLADGATAPDAAGPSMPGMPGGIEVPSQPVDPAADGTPADAGADGGGVSAADDGVLRGAAVAGLRVGLTGSDGGRQRYLELATPVAVESLADGVALVLVDAVWLEGEEGSLSEAHQGRWAIPVADDGTVLGAPWPVDGPPPALPAGDPPLGAVRLAEVAPAMAAAGWTDVVAVAADPHPFLDEVVVALVSGTAPGGAVRDGDVVWLRAQGDGLVLLGAAS